MCVVNRLARRTLAETLGLSESSGKTSHAISDSFWNSLSLRGGVWVVDVSWGK